MNKKVITQEKWFKMLVVMLPIILAFGLIFTFKYAFATVFLACTAIMLIHILNAYYIKTRKQGARSLAFLIGLGLTAFIMLFVYLQTQIHSGINYQVPEQSFDYIIVLGGGTDNGVVKEGLRNRLDLTLEVYKEFPDATYILTGGVGPGEKVSEASAMEDYLIAGGMTGVSFILEEKSMSTADNFDFCQSILAEIGAMNHEMLVITSDYHINRALYLAYDRGYNVRGLAAKTRALKLVENTTREFYATIKTYLVD